MPAFAWEFLDEVGLPVERARRIGYLAQDAAAHDVAPPVDVEVHALGDAQALSLSIRLLPMMILFVLPEYNQ